MEVQNYSCGQTPSPRGRGRARGRARPHAADSDAPRPGLDGNCNKVQPVVHTYHNTATQSETELASGKGGQDEHVSQADNNDNSTAHKAVPRSRRYNFDTPMMSLINRHLGQARVESPGQSRSHERLNYTSLSSGALTSTGNSGAHTPQATYDLRHKLSRSVTPETTSRTNGVSDKVVTSERPRSGTFPLTSDTPGDADQSSQRTSNAPPPDPPYRGMHDHRSVRTEVQPLHAHDHEAGRGRGRSRGRARHVDTNNHVTLRPGSTSPSQLQHDLSDVDIVDQFTDAGRDDVDDDVVEIQSEMLTLTVTTKGDGVRSCAVKTNGAVKDADVTSLVHATSGTVNGMSDSGHGSYETTTSSRGFSSQGSPGSETGNTEVASSNPHQNERSVSPTRPGSRHRSSGKRSPLTLHIPDEPSPSLPKADGMNKSESKSSVLSPDFLVTPPGYQKVLDWAAEVSSPLSPIEAPDWA